MHSHANPKGGVTQILRPQGSPAKSSSAMWGDVGARVYLVVPAQAGTDTPQPALLEKEDNDVREKQFPLVVMGPGLRRDDKEPYRFALACSAELWAASASLAEISAVAAAVPQLGASLPSPQLRGR